MTKRAILVAGLDRAIAEEQERGRARPPSRFAFDPNQPPAAMSARFAAEEDDEERDKPPLPPPQEDAPPIDVEHDAHRLADAALQRLEKNLDGIAAEVGRAITTGRSDLPAAQKAYADSLGKAQLAADLVGQQSVRSQLAGAAPPAEAAGQTFEPSERARRLGALLDKPAVEILAQFGRGLALTEAQQVRIRDRYAFGRTFTLAKAASQAITDRAREIVLRAAKEGTPIREARAVVQELQENFTPAYAETVVRTNLVNAYSAGRFRAATDPEIAAGVAGFEFMATHDSNVRPNHLAADAFFAATDDPAWDRLTPPLGFNCRCGLRLVTSEEMRRRGAKFSTGIPAGAHPDNAGFGRRPELY